MNEREAMDRLDAYLDGLASGERAEPGDLDPGLTAIAERVDRLDRRPAPEAARARVWRSLMENVPERRAGASPNGTLPIPLTSEPSRAHHPVAIRRRPSLERWGRLLNDLAAVVLVVLVMASTLLLASGGLSGLIPDWWDTDEPRVAMPRGSAANSGEINATGPSGPPVERWHVQLPTGTASYAAPVVAGDLIYVAPPGGTLVAFDLATGEERWRFRGPDDLPVSGAPAVADGVVYVGTVDGTLFALDALTGLEHWQLDLGSPFTTPVVDNGMAYVSATNAQGAYPAVGDGVVLFVGSCGCDELIAVDLATAVVKWTFAISDAGPVAVDAVTGTKRWSSTAEVAAAAPAIADETVYVLSSDGSLVALALADGQERWRAALVPGQSVASTQVTSPTVSDDSVMVVMRDGTLAAWDSESGVERWRRPLGASVAAPAVVADRVLYVGDLNGGIHAVDLKSGNERWTYTLHGWVSGPLTVAGGLVYVVDHRGVLYALGDPVGTEQD
jgi:outer membrane protein assembly factor BamB